MNVLFLSQKCTVAMDIPFIYGAFNNKYFYLFICLTLFTKMNYLRIDLFLQFILVFISTV